MGEVKADPMVPTAVEEFPWQSEEQKEGYLALVQYERGFGFAPKLPLDTLAAFLIQKAHESNEYWREFLGTQVGGLEDQIRQLQEGLAEANRAVDQLRETVKNQTMLLEHLSQKLKTP